MLTPAQYTALGAELDNDPVNLGYAPFVAAGNDVALAGMVNHVRDGATPLVIDGAAIGNVGAAITIRRTDITPEELMEAIDNRDLGTGTQNTNALAGALLNNILARRTIKLAEVDGSLTRTRQNLNRLILNTQASQTRFDALAIRNGSRAEQMLETNVQPTIEDIVIARNS